MQTINPLRRLEPVRRPSVADTVFEELHRQILTLELPPGTRMSEVDVASALGVSRQPVRDAFYRLSQLGFLTIRPQKATTVSLISERAVLQARFIRTAIELETVRAACDHRTDAQIEALNHLLERQRLASDAGEAQLFHELDDQFHQLICDCAEQSHAGPVIRENKAHMDRVRLLVLPVVSGGALADHALIVNAIRVRDTDLAVQRMRTHLHRIEDQIRYIDNDYRHYFKAEDEDA